MHVVCMCACAAHIMDTRQTTRGGLGNSMPAPQHLAVEITQGCAAVLQKRSSSIGRTGQPLPPLNRGMPMLRNKRS